MICPPVEQLLSKADSLVIKFKQGSEVVYIDEAIVLDREALDLCHPSHPERSAALTQLASHLWHRYQQLGGIDDLNTAIVLDRDALVLCPPGNPLRSTSLNNLALHLATRYNQLGDINDLNEALVLFRDALILHPPWHPDRSTSLNNLAAHLSTRFKQLGEVGDLHEAIVLGRDALVHRPPGHSDRSTSLNNLAAHLSTRFKQLGEVSDLHEAIVLAREALALRPPGHPLRSTSSNNLAAHLSARYKQLGEVDDLNEAIVLGRDALARRPPGHPDRSTSLNNLALHLYTRYKQLGGIEDLDETIVLDRDGLVLCPPGHPLRSTSLNNLAAHLYTRYNQLGGIDDLNEAIVLDRHALVLRPPGHAFRSMSLNNLAAHLHTRYKRLGKVDDLGEAIVLDRDALALCPPGHLLRSTLLNNLAAYLSTRFKQLGEVSDNNEAIVLARDALALRPPGHPDRSRTLVHLTQYLRTRFTQLGAIQDQEELFSLYAQLQHVSQTVSSSDVSVARAWINAAEDFHHPTTLFAYETALRLLVHHLAVLPSLPQHFAVLKALSSSLAADAFSACLRNSSPTKAVELLEQGRGVFWSQLTRLRSPLDDVVASGSAGKVAADEFTHLTSLIRNSLDSPGVGQHDEMCHLNSELRRVVSNIRKLPGLSRFLLPPSFSDLQRAASGGPIIIVNASKYSCDALVVFVDKDPVHIPLSITKARVEILSSQLHVVIQRAKSMDVTRELALLLRELWDNVVFYIVEFLQTTCPRYSRIWWCPTAEFSPFPWHAASPFRKGQRNLSDLYISSYAPTLTALIRARRPSTPNSATQRKHFIAIGQTRAIGTAELLSVGTELANIGQRIDGLATFTRIEGEDSCISRVAYELGKNEWVHLACHGVPNQKQPFESAFALHDGYFTIQHIIQCDLKNAEFVYLSACHTTVGDEESSDEMICLASAMQFAGFRSVIGTMWAEDDTETNKITSVFYEHMVDESGHLDHTRAAFALHKTMRSVKSIPLDQRILYKHIGA